MKFFSIILLAVLLVSLSANSQDYQDWKFVHPKPQPNLLKRIDAVDANTWFAVGANGTFMRTVNGGANWNFQHFCGRPGPALDVSQNYNLWFFNSTTGIVVGDRGYIGRTTNGGVTFDSVALGLIIPINQRAQGIWFFDNNTGFVVSGSGSGFAGTIVKTTNGGLNWASVNTTTATAYSSVWGTDAQTVYVTQVDGKILKTTNGGTNWIESPVVMGIYMSDITFLNSTTGIVCGSLGKIYRTTNAGTSWDSVGSGQANWGLSSVKIVSANEMYVTGDPSFLYKSTDGGATWIGLPITVSGPTTTFIWYSIDKVGSTLIMSGDYGIIAKSTDGGLTWSSNSFLLSTAAMFDIQTLPGSPKVWVVGRPQSSTNKQVFFSSDYGTNWVTYDLGVTGDFFAISMVNELTGYVTGQNSRVLKTTNGGANWVLKTQPHATNYSLYSTEFINENTGWTFVNFATVTGGNVFKTTNGGDNWTQYTTGGASENIYSADMVDANTGYVCYNQSNRPVYKTTDGGAAWTPLTTGLTGNIRDIDAVTGDLVYVCQTSGTQRVAKTTNGGANWTLITLPVTVDATSIDFKDANTGYVCGNLTTAICKTTDGGNTWTFQNAHTITLGKIHVSAGDTAFVAGGITTIMRAVGSTLTGVHYNGNTVPDDFVLKQNYPNPFNPSTTIEFAIPKSAVVSVKIFDITGREIETEINNLSLNAGTFKLNFDASSLTSGVYFYRLIVDGAAVNTRKMILLK